MATAIHFGAPNLRVAMIDCDNQATNYEIRKRDLELLDQDHIAKERYDKLNNTLGRPIYPIVRARLSKPGDVKTTLEGLEKRGYNFILIDLPGNTEIPGVTDALMLINYLFIPVHSDDGSINSSVSYITSIKAMMYELRKSNPALEDIYVYFTLYSRNERNRDNQIFVDLRQEFTDKGIKVLQNGFFASTSFKYELASTLFPFPNTKQYENISPYPLFSEVVDTIYDQIKTKKENLAAEKEEKAKIKPINPSIKIANE
jgi:cellulose biosynthesis protein BcsQ